MLFFTYLIYVRDRFLEFALKPNTYLNTFHAPCTHPALAQQAGCAMPTLAHASHKHACVQPWPLYITVALQSSECF